jgi:prolyl-tRNA editing enzyme YbaK/EbsC (Cys-tRNA(Pro) deacylase)
MERLRSIKILERKGIEYRLIELEEEALSVNDVIKFSKEEINVNEICKTMILKDKYGGRYAFFLLGIDRVDYKKAREIVGKNVSIASFQEVKETVGVDPGAVCPILLKIDLYVDSKVMNLRKINFGSGNHLFGLEIRTCDLEKVVDFRVVDIVKIVD